MLTYQLDGMDTGYPLLLREVLHQGRDIAARGLPALELGPVSIELSNPRYSMATHPARKLNQAFAIAEFLWVLAGRDDPEVLLAFNSNLTAWVDQELPTWPWVGSPLFIPVDEDTVSCSVCGTAKPAEWYPARKPRFFGAYGPPVMSQLPYVLAKLSEPDSRQAVLTIWRPNPPPTKDVPCTVALQFLARDGRLGLITYMRSNDLWLGTPYDLQLFTQLQLWVAMKLKLKVGSYHHVVGSLHLYRPDWEKAVGVVEAGPTGGEASLVDFVNDVSPVELWKVVEKMVLEREQPPKVLLDLPDWGGRLENLMVHLLEKEIRRAERAAPPPAP